MSGRWPRGLERSPASTSTSIRQALPFTNESVPDEEISGDDGEFGSHSRARPIRAQTPQSSSYLSSSYQHRTPARSFLHQASHGQVDNPQYSSQGVRERTQALAAFALADEDTYTESNRWGISVTTDSEVHSKKRRIYGGSSSGVDTADTRESFESSHESVIEETSEPETPETITSPTHSGKKNSLSQYMARDGRTPDGHTLALASDDLESQKSIKGSLGRHSEESRPLLSKAKISRTQGDQGYGTAEPLDVPDQRGSVAGRLSGYVHNVRNHFTSMGKTFSDPNTWSSRNLSHQGLVGVKMLSAVFLGLLLNILDGLSYGLILFPLGEDVFSSTGPDGISIFFVSCIVSQVVYSSGASIFRGGVGSEMIEVVPFFHKMAYAIMGHMGSSDPEAVLATVIVSYALSSIITGLIFLALGLFKLGSLVSFFPRNILTGCVGGVGFFLFVTGVEVSARLDGNLDYNLKTLHKLFESDTVLLWLLPLSLAVLIIVIRHFYKSPLILPIFFIVIISTFYVIVKPICHFDLEVVRRKGWIFPQPETGVPFYRFYTYYKFELVDWSAIGKTIPTMFALSFFGIIHVPINVPALGVAVKEDDVNINRELIAHGLSNSISGFVGSIQNYLVYANSVLFIDNGGDSRAAGFLLAAATAAVWTAGPGMIGFIPVCIVGTLIFMLGIELLMEAVWEPFGKLHRLEYLTIIAIVLIMGVYDFVVGIVAGIVLACLNYVVQSSRTPAIRAIYNGEIAESTVRRPRLDRKYLNQVRSQICVQKLSGYLFFGTIVAVEQEMRALIGVEALVRKPIKYVIVDFTHVTRIDFSAAEAFTRMNRILCRQKVKMILSGVSFSDDVGRSLAMVGLLDSEKRDPGCPPPKVYEDLNNALEACENEMLELFYKQRRSAHRSRSPPPSLEPNSIPVPSHIAESSSVDAAWHSPRQNLLLRAATSTIAEGGDVSIQEGTSNFVPSKWKNFAQPVKIMLQTFEDVSAKNEDFWHRAASFFERRQFSAGAILYSRGDDPDGFYLLESGRFRAEYELEQGAYYEVILPGTTCGELPFFSETFRTGTVAAEDDSIAWLLTRESFEEMEKKEPEIAAELLKIGLKLTSERMNAITSYVLVTAT